MKKEKNPSPFVQLLEFMRLTIDFYFPFFSLALIFRYSRILQQLQLSRKSFQNCNYKFYTHAKGCTIQSLHLHLDHYYMYTNFSRRIDTPNVPLSRSERPELAQLISIPVTTISTFNKQSRTRVYFWYKFKLFISLSHPCAIFIIILFFNHSQFHPTSKTVIFIVL